MGVREIDRFLEQWQMDASITTTLHQVGCLVSGNCIGERSRARLSCKLAHSREGIPKSLFILTVVVILNQGQGETRR